MQEISRLLKNRRTEVQKIKHIYTQAIAQHKREKEALEGAKSLLESIIVGRGVIQEVAQHIQQQAHNQIAAVVTKGLQSVFDEPYTFKIDFEKKRGRTEARLIFERDGLELDPLTASGGGVIDVAAFSLRVACLALSRPAVRPLLILDEPFKNVSKANGYLDRIPALLEILCEDIGIQIIMVTHIEELKVGKIVEVGNE